MLRAQQAVLNVPLIFLVSLPLLLAACSGNNDNPPDTSDDITPEVAVTMTSAPIVGLIIKNGAIDIESITKYTNDRTLVSEKELTYEAVAGSALEPDNPVAENTPPLVEIVTEPLGQTIDDYLSQNSFWGTALVAQGNDVILHKAYGDIYGRGISNAISNAINTPFYIGSVTKQFAGAAIQC